MKTRAEDLEDAVKEALQMLARGRPADAQETLSAALDAPTDDRAVRDAALEEAAQEFDRIASASAGTMYAKVVANHAKRTRALQSAPAQVVSKAKVREVVQRLMAHFNEQTPIQSGYRGALRQVAVDLGVDLDATGETFTAKRPDRPTCDRADCCASVDCPCACHAEAP